MIWCLQRPVILQMEVFQAVACPSPGPGVRTPLKDEGALSTGTKDQFPSMKRQFPHNSACSTMYSLKSILLGRKVEAKWSQVVLFVLSPLNTWSSLGCKHHFKSPFCCPGHSPLAPARSEFLPSWQWFSCFPALVVSFLQHPPFPLSCMSSDNPPYQKPPGHSLLSVFFLVSFENMCKWPLGVLNMMIYCSDYCISVFHVFFFLGDFIS